MKSSVSIIALDKRFKKLEKDLKKITSTLVQFLELDRVEFEVYLVGRKMMREINHRFLGKNEPTGVLSFTLPREFPQVSSPNKKLGEIYLCPPVVRERKEKFEALLAHGLLHLLGFNHDLKNARMGMEKLELNFLKWLKQRS